MIRDEQGVIWDSWWKYDPDGLLDFVANSDWLDEDSTDEEKESAYVDYIYDMLADEERNLDVELDGTVLMYGDAGRWDGTFYGASPVGTNLNGILHAFDGDGDVEVKFYVEDDDVYARWSGHDNPMGTIALFRLADDDYLERIMDEGVQGEESFLANTSSIADEVCRVYGW